MYTSPLSSYLPPYDKSFSLVDLTSSNVYPLRETNYINIYTDGSKTNDGTGATFIIFPPSESLRHGSYMLNNSNSVYQAELYAILKGEVRTFSIF